MLVVGFPVGCCLLIVLVSLVILIAWDCDVLLLFVGVCYAVLGLRCNLMLLFSGVFV